MNDLSASAIEMHSDLVSSSTKGQRGAHGMPGKPGPMVSVLLSHSFIHLFTLSSICTFINMYEAPTVSQMLGVTRQ